MIRARLRRWLCREYLVCTHCGGVHREGWHLRSGDVCPMKRLEGRVASAENSAAAANSRAERMEAALARAEGRVAALEDVTGLNVRLIPNTAVDPARPGSDVTVSEEVPA